MSLATLYNTAFNMMIFHFILVHMTRLLYHSDNSTRFSLLSRLLFFILVVLQDYQEFNNVNTKNLKRY